MVNTLHILATLASISACVSASPRAAKIEKRDMYWAPTRFVKSYWSPVHTYSTLFGGAIVDVDDDGQGTRTVTQKEIQPGLPSPKDGVQKIDWSFGPVRTSGTIDTSDFGIRVAVSIAGITLGEPLEGNMKDGVSAKFDLFAARGGLKYYLKNGNEIWIHVDVKVVFDGSFYGDYKILSF